MNRSKHIRPILLLLAAAALSSCIRLNKPAVFVPEQPTAKEQYALAYRKEADVRMAREGTSRHASQLEMLKESYQAVARRFPEDRTYTPWARIRLSQLALKEGSPQKAMEMADGVMIDFGDIAAVDAMARYMQARALEEMGNVREAQQAYRECMNRYGDSDDERAAKVAATCEQLYERVLLESP